MQNPILRFLKNDEHSNIIWDTNNLFLDSSGLYNAANTTAPNPPSNKEIKLRNCFIDEINPFTSDPKAFITTLGKIKPEIIVIIWNINADTKFNLFLIY